MICVSLGGTTPTSHVFNGTKVGIEFEHTLFKLQYMIEKKFFHLDGEVDPYSINNATVFLGNTLDSYSTHLPSERRMLIQ